MKSRSKVNKVILFIYLLVANLIYFTQIYRHKLWHWLGLKLRLPFPFFLLWSARIPLHPWTSRLPFPHLILWRKRSTEISISRRKPSLLTRLGCSSLPSLEWFTFLATSLPPTSLSWWWTTTASQSRFWIWLDWKRCSPWSSLLCSTWKWGKKFQSSVFQVDCFKYRKHAALASPALFSLDDEVLLYWINIQIKAVYLIWWFITCYTYREPRNRFVK